MDKSPDSGKSSLLAFIGLGTASALFGAVKLADPDLWWHLAGGRLIWEGGIPAVNTFSHSYPGHPWRHTQWLFDAVLRALEVFGGLTLVEFFQMTLVAAAFLLTFDTVRRKTGRANFFLLLPLFLIALSASRFRFVPRPHLVTYVGLALLLNLWERRSLRTPLWFGLTGLIWGNSHAGVAFGLAVAILIAVSALLAKDRPAARTAGLSCVAFLAGSLINPNTIYPYVYSFSHLTIGNIVPLEEFKHPSFAANTSYFLMAAIAVAAIPFRLAKKDYLYPLLALSFLPLSLSAQRIIPKFILVVLPGIGATAGDLWSGISDRNDMRRFRYAALTAVLASSFLLVSSDYRNTSQFQEFGWGVNDRWIPEGAARFIEENRIHGRMYNDFGQGGYLIWRLFPERRVLIDGRVQAYPVEFFREFFGQMNRQEWPKFVGKYGIGYAVVERRPYGSRIDMSALFDAMGWRLMYIDGISYVYVRPGTEEDLRLKPYRFQFFRATGSGENLISNSRQHPTEMLSELARIDPERLILAEDFLRFGASAFTAGGVPMAEVFFRSGLKLHPKDPELRINLAFLLYTQGNLREARKEYKIVAGEGNDSRIAELARKRLDEIGR